MPEIIIKPYYESIHDLIKYIQNYENSIRIDV